LVLYLIFSIVCNVLSNNLHWILSNGILEGLCMNYYYSLQGICVTNEHGCVPFVVITFRSFPHSWFISGFVTEATRRSPEFTPLFVVGWVARSLVFCVMFCRWLFVPLSFLFWSLCCLSFWDLRRLITTLVYSAFSYVIYSSLVTDSI
jgi:hypothetical protein